MSEVNVWESGGLATILAANIEDKTEALTIDPVNDRLYYINSVDGRGNIWRGVTGLTAGTIVDDGGLFCGTEIRPTGGDGSAGLVRDYNKAIEFAWYGGSTLATAAVNAAVLQTFIDVLSSRSANGHASGGTYEFNTAIVLKSNIKLFGDGVFSTIFKYTGIGTNGFETAITLDGVVLKDFQLLGTNTTNAAENGISITGGTAAGMPKLILSNLLVKEWGNKGVYMQDVFDCVIEYVNSSSNKSHGFHIINSFGMSYHKNVAYQNAGYGAYIQSAAGSSFSGTLQENDLNGMLVESAKACNFNMYAEQNGHNTAVAVEKGQFLLTQRSGGFQESSGNNVNIYTLGGKGSAMESTYGVYLDFANNNKVGGNHAGHLTSDIYLSSNSANNIIDNPEHETGLAGGDSPATVTNNGLQNGYASLAQTELSRTETLSYASQAASRSITFVKAFASVPAMTAVIVNSVTTAAAIVKINNISTTGFDFVVTDGSALVVGSQVNFMAKGL